MRQIDKLNLEVYEELIVEFNILSKEYGIYSNIIGVFFHEIMQYLTNYLIIKNSTHVYNHKVSFPYLNTEYCLNPVLIDFNKLARNKYTFKECVTSILLKVFFSFGEKIIMVDSFTLKEFPQFIFKNIFKYKFRLVLPSQVYLKHADQQVDLLESLLMRMSTKYKINNKEVFVKNFIRYIDKYIGRKPTQRLYDAVFCTSNAILKNRINCCNHISNNKLVVSFAHGNVMDFMIFDEPIIGYGELSYCDYYVSYGGEDARLGKYNLPLSGHNVKILKRHSTLIETLNNATTIGKANRNMNGLFIPGSFNENRRYGPFRDVNDETYIRLQEAIFSQDLNLTSKERPENKSRKSQDHYISGKDKAVFVKLESFNFKGFDYIVIDYPTTALTISMATNLPILYFNMGLRNLTSDALKDIKKRVFWVDIDMSKNLNNQIQQGFYEFFNSTIEYKKDFLFKFSFSKNTSEECIQKTLRNFNA